MSNIRFTAEVNGELEFSISEKEIAELDVVSGPDGSYHILWEGKGYPLQIETSDFSKKEFTIRTENRVITVHLRNRTEQKVHSMGLEAVTQSHVDKIIAPMPGLVLKVNVQSGDQISKGDTLLILEAMKMENVISAPNDGIVKKVLVSEGNSIEKSEILVILD